MPLTELPHITEIKVRFNELDPYGHVNHAQYVSYFEHARTEALEALGIGITDMAARGFQIVVMEIIVNYKKPAVGADVLRVETWVTELRRASTRWRQRILCDGEVYVTIELRAAVTDTNGKPARPAPWMFEAMEPLVIPDPEPS